MFKLLFKIFSLILVCFFTVNISYAQLRDPTQPAEGNTRSQVVSNLTLNTILISFNQRAVVINKQFLKTGDFIDGAEVLSIGENDVKLKRGNETFTIALFPTFVKRSNESRSYLSAMRKNVME